VTYEEAWAEARRRWAPAGDVYNMGRSGCLIYFVGPDRNTMFFGHSWEEAFHWADLEIARRVVEA
jgi:hypothetical protein